MLRWVGFIVSLFLITGAAWAQAPAQTTPSANPLAHTAQSHILGNLPDQANFEKFLSRDLTTYFTKAAGKKVTVKYELLRNGPTQSGFSYPKYYLWVRVFRGGKLSETGAVRVAALEKTHFEVTTFLTQARMKRNPEQIYGVFPRPVGDKIKMEKLKP